MADTDNTTGSDLIGVREAAEQLGVEGIAVYRLIDEGHLPGWKGRNGLMVTSARAVTDLAGTDRAG